MINNPYDYFTHADQLDETTLPTCETFYSTIKNCNVLEEEHVAFQKLVNQGKSEQEAPLNITFNFQTKNWP